MIIVDVVVVLFFAFVHFFEFCFPLLGNPWFRPLPVLQREFTFV